jgi:hypothetical protein
MNANWGFFVARLISAIGSWLDASNLRNRVYKLENENEIMRTALDDILRIDPNSQAGWIAEQTKIQLDKE